MHGLIVYLLNFQEFDDLAVEHSHNKKLNYMNLKITYFKKTHRGNKYSKLLNFFFLHFDVIYVLRLLMSAESVCR